MAAEEHLAPLDHQEYPVYLVHKDHQDHLEVEHPVFKGQQGLKDHQDHLGDHQDLQGHRVILVYKVLLEQEFKVKLAQKVIQVYKALQEFKVQLA